MTTQTLSAGGLFDTEAFFDEAVKIASLKKKLVAGAKKLGLVEDVADAAVRTVRKESKNIPGPSPEAISQLKQMKLQRQLDAMKAARGLA